MNTIENHWIGMLSKQQREPEPVMRCDICGEPMFAGDKYAILGGATHCYPCLENFTVGDWLNLMGEPMYLAG